MVSGDSSKLSIRMRRRVMNYTNHEKFVVPAASAGSFPSDWGEWPTSQPTPPIVPKNRKLFVSMLPHVTSKSC